MKSTFIDLKNPDLYREGIPHEVFARLRREAPVAWNPEEDGRGFWAVTRYEDIVAVSKNPKVFSSARKHGGHRMFDENVVGVAGVGADKTEAPMISMDPPEHNLYRRMVSPGFAPRRVQALEERIRHRVIGILDRLQGADTCDFVVDMIDRCIGVLKAGPLPAENKAKIEAGKAREICTRRFTKNVANYSRKAPMPKRQKRGSK